MYYYKFIVDGEWKFSPDDPTAPDEHGNINNIIDTTNIESVNKMMGSSMDVRKVTTTEMKGQVAENPFTDEAPLLPSHLMGIYFLNVIGLRNICNFAGKRKETSRRKSFGKEIY